MVRFFGSGSLWKIELASGDPFGISCLWDRWTDPASRELVVSFSMLTVNVDEHPSVFSEIDRACSNRGLAAASSPFLRSSSTKYLRRESVSGDSGPSTFFCYHARRYIRLRELVLQLDGRYASSWLLIIIIGGAS